jgi:multidrug efflux pump subunit AcrA (membrane-fusion protein)
MMHFMWQKIKNVLSTSSKKVKNGGKAVGAVFQKTVATRPFTAFLMVLALLVASIAVGQKLKPAPITQETELEPKSVEILTINENPELTIQAKIDKAGYVKLIAQSSGVVQKIRVHEGGSVKRGTAVVSLSTNYQGGNISSVSRQIAQKNVTFLNETYQTQLDAIGKSREIAQKSETQQAQLRSIARQSIDDTKTSITLNEDILNTLDKQIKALESINVNGASDSAILALKGSKSQTLNALNGLRSGLRNTEYVNSDDKEAAQIAQLVRDNTLKQLEIQEKSLLLNKEVSGLNLKISQISESLMYPASPCAGVVERVYVKEGQLVNPGTILAIIKTNDTSASALGLVSSEIARSISPLNPSYLLIGGERVAVQPRYISIEPTDGSLHSVLYSVPEEYAHLVKQDSFISVAVPIGLGQSTTSTNLYIPLDAVYQSQDEASVYLMKKDAEGHDVVERQAIVLGPVFGRYVEIESGLTGGEEIILSRNVIPGERVQKGS